MHLPGSSTNMKRAGPSRIGSVAEWSKALDLSYLYLTPSGETRASSNLAATRDFSLFCLAPQILCFYFPRQKIEGKLTRGSATMEIPRSLLKGNVLCAKIPHRKEGICAVCSATPYCAFTWLIDKARLAQSRASS